MIGKSFLMLIGAATLIVAPQPAHAEGTAKEFSDMLRVGGQPEFAAKIFIHATASGLGWANAELESRGEKPLFCEPKKMGMAPEQTAMIFNKFLKEHPLLENTPAGLVVLRSFQATFPCER